MATARPPEPTADATDAPGAVEAAHAAAVLEAVLDTADDAVFLLDGRGWIEGWNRSAERYVGRHPDEMLGETVVALFSAHVRAQVAAVLDAVHAGDSVRHHETELMRRDGMPMPVSLSLCPVFRSDGTTNGAVLVVRDITEQRLAQAALAEVEARVQEGEAMAHVGSWLWDLRTGAVQWSDELHRIHGLDPAAFDGTLDAHLATLHPAERDRVRALLDAAVSSGRPFEDEYRIVRPDRGVRLIRVRAQPTRDSRGAVVGLRGVGQDLGPTPGDRGP